MVTPMKTIDKLNLLAMFDKSLSAIIIHLEKEEPDTVKALRTAKGIQLVFRKAVGYIEGKV